jgi:hypothetical protein
VLDDAPRLSSRLRRMVSRAAGTLIIPPFLACGVILMPRVLNIDRLVYKVTPGAVYIGRAMPQYGLPGSKWINPFEIDQVRSRRGHQRV